MGAICGGMQEPPLNMMDFRLSFAKVSDLQRQLFRAYNRDLHQSLGHAEFVKILKVLREMALNCDGSHSRMVAGFYAEVCSNAPRGAG